MVVVRQDGTIYALEGVCPHQGGLLAEGSVEGDRLICPVHQAAFAVGSGEVRADPFGVEPPLGAVVPLAKFPVRVVRGLIEIDLG